MSEEQREERKLTAGASWKGRPYHWSCAQREKWEDPDWGENEVDPVFIYDDARCQRCGATMKEAGEKIHKHCWHRTAALLSDPPIYKYICCHCGVHGKLYPTKGTSHGKFGPPVYTYDESRMEPDGTP